MTRRVKFTLIGCAVLTLGGGAAALAGATGDDEGDDRVTDRAVLDRAGAAARPAAGGGRVTGVERENEGAVVYEVEIRRPDGSEVEVALDRGFRVVAGDGDEDARPDMSKLEPADFTTRIDNPYWPMAPGSRWVYRETDGEGGTQRIVVSVTDRTRSIDGITARVVHDRVTEEGRIVEDTFDWYAQDKDGNVWYLGEDTTEHDGGQKSTKGSWEAGVDGAETGIAMLADPRVGQRYQQEFYRGEAEDMAQVLSVDEQAEVPFGHFEDVLLTKDLTPLEPRVAEYKLYARGVGPVLALHVSGGSGREELISYTK